MDELYYEDGQVPDLASSGFTFSDEVIAKALVGIYKGEVDIDKGVEQNLYKETLRILNKATAKGIADAIDGGAPAPKKDFLWQLRHSNEVFSAFKTHTQQNHLADLLTDSKGKLKPFGQFAKDSEAVIGKYNRQWLRTEYDTAVIRAHQAANWQKFEEEKDVLPNLEWIPSTSPNPSEDHMVFWGTILPVDDGFWDAHRPGDRWNCKCDLRSTDKAATHAPDADIISKHDEPAKGLDNNPGKDGKIFNQSHPYFPKSCAACPFSSNGKPSPLADKIVGDCNRCSNVPTGVQEKTSSVVTEKVMQMHDDFLADRKENFRNLHPVVIYTIDDEIKNFLHKVGITLNNDDLLIDLGGITHAFRATKIERGQNIEASHLRNFVNNVGNSEVYYDPDPLHNNIFFITHYDGGCQKYVFELNRRKGINRFVTAGKINDYNVQDNGCIRIK